MAHMKTLQITPLVKVFLVSVVLSLVLPVFAQNAQQQQWQRQQDMQRQQDQQRQQEQQRQRDQAQAQQRQQAQDQMRQQMQEQQRQQMQAQQRQQMQQQQQAQQRQQLQTQQQNQQRLSQQQQQQAQQNQQRLQQQARAQGTLQQGSNRPSGMVLSGGVAKMTRPLTPGEIQRGFTGKVTADGKALIRFQGRVFTVPASRISGLSAKLAAQQNQQRAQATRWTASQQSAVSTRFKALAARTGGNAAGNADCGGPGQRPCPNGGGGGNPPSGANSGCTPPDSLTCKFNRAAANNGAATVEYAPTLQARLDEARLAKSRPEPNLEQPQPQPQPQNTLSFGKGDRKLDFLFDKNIDQSNKYNADRAASNAKRIGIADTTQNRAEVTRLFEKAYQDPSSIVRPGSIKGSNVRELFLPGLTSTGSRIEFVEKDGQVITIMAK